MAALLQKFAVPGASCTLTHTRRVCHRRCGPQIHHTEVCVREPRKNRNSGPAGSKVQDHLTRHSLGKCRYALLRYPMVSREHANHYVLDTRHRTVLPTREVDGNLLEPTKRTRRLSQPLLMHLRRISGTHRWSRYGRPPLAHLGVSDDFKLTGRPATVSVTCWQICATR